MFANTISGHGKPSPKHPNAVYSSDLNFSWSDPDLDDTQDGGGSSPMAKSPWNNKWLLPEPVATPKRHRSTTALVGSLVREEGHVYSLATTPGGFLYTGSDSKNIRVWKGLKDYAGFKSSSGLVKAIVIAGEKIFTGHQDGKIRVWKVSDKDPSVHKRSGSLPTFKALFKSSIKPSSFVEAKRRIKHSDAISSLSLAEEDGILYSSSWDRTFKVWRISDSKCIESVLAHEDAVNSVVTAGPESVFTGSADGTVKVWRREAEGKGTTHFLVKTLLKQDCAVTAVAVGPAGTVVYCGSSDGLVSFWDRKRLAYGGALRGHKLAVLCLVAKGRMVFSGSADKSICVWRRDGSAVHTRVAVLSGHSGPVKCLAVEEDEKERWKLYSGSLDKSVKVWRVCEFVD